jgi:cytochrome c biogenesis protein CcmG, thiol:disulfide interchange protein DsbE
VIDRLARAGGAGGRLQLEGRARRCAALAAQFGDPYALIVVDFEGRTAIEFGVYGAPESFLIDADGRVLYKHIGPITWADVEREILPRLPTTEWTGP